MANHADRPKFEDKMGLCSLAELGEMFAFFSAAHSCTRGSVGNAYRTGSAYSVHVLSLSAVYQVF